MHYAVTIIDIVGSSSPAAVPALWRGVGGGGFAVTFHVNVAHLGGPLDTHLWTNEKICYVYALVKTESMGGT